MAVRGYVEEEEGSMACTPHYHQYAHLLFVVGEFGVLEQLFETFSPYKDWRVCDESASSLHIVFADIDGSNQEEKERLTLVLAHHE